MSNTKLLPSFLIITLITLISFQVSAKTFRWTDRGTATDDNGKDFRTKIKYRVEIEKNNICSISLHVNAKMNGKNSRSTISYSTYVDGSDVGLTYGQTFSYKRAKGSSSKMFTIDGYNNLRFKGKEQKFSHDVTVVNLRDLEFDLYDEGEGLNELNHYTEKLSAKCKIHDAKRLKNRDAAFKKQKVYLDEKISHKRSKQALRHLTSKKYLNSINYNNTTSGRTSDFFLAKGKSLSDEKLANIYKIKDKDIGSCVAAQGQHFNNFFTTEKQNADKAKLIPWMYSFNITQPVLHLLDTRHSGNEGVTRKAYLGKDAKWHIYFVLGKPSSQYDKNKHDSYCFLVRENDLVGIINSFYQDDVFQNAKVKLDKKLKTAIGEANKNRAAQRQKQFEQQFKKNPSKTLKAIENNFKAKFSKFNAKITNSKDFKKAIQATQKDMFKVLKLVKKSHPKFYKDNFKRFNNKNWYRRYLKAEK